MFTFVKKDEWLGQDMTVAVGSLQLDAKNIDFLKKTIDLSSLVIDKPYFSLFNYQRLKPKPAPDTIKAITPHPLIQCLTGIKAAG